MVQQQKPEQTDRQTWVEFLDLPYCARDGQHGNIDLISFATQSKCNLGYFRLLFYSGPLKNWQSKQVQKLYCELDSLNHKKKIIRIE